MEEWRRTLQAKGTAGAKVGWYKRNAGRARNGKTLRVAGYKVLVSSVGFSGAQYLHSLAFRNV